MRTFAACVELSTKKQYNDEMKKIVLFILIATFTIIIGCASDTKKEPTTGATAPKEELTRENWRAATPSKEQMDSLREKAHANKGNANIGNMSNEQITHSANSYADLYCRCQGLPAEAKQPNTKNSQIEKPKFVETKPICTAAVNRSTQIISDGLKNDAAKQKLFLDTYNASVKSCK